MYRYVDAALIRAAAGHPDTQVTWPDLVSTTSDPTSWRTWLQEVWQIGDFAEAVSAASPDLASRVEQICAGHHLPEPTVRRVVLTLLRYLLRASTRATPFGLFAGVAATRTGVAPALRLGSEHRPTARADAAQSTPLIDRFERHPALRPHLMLLTSTLAVERDDHVAIDHRPSGKPGAGLEHVRIRMTEPVRAALDGARTPIPWCDLAAKLAAGFPNTAPHLIDKLLASLVTQQFLLTSLRQAMTTHDPLTGLRDHEHRLSTQERAEVRATPRHAQDLLLDCDLTIPDTVAREAAAAAKALTRLAPRAALTGWAEWHDRFLDRYGPRAVIPVLDAIDALGYPPGYLGATAAPTLSPLPDRDARLIKLAHTAAVQGRLEIVLDDAALDSLATTDAEHPVQPSTELAVRIDAADSTALERGEFSLHVVGVARSAGATTGRFLDMLPDDDRRRMTEAYAALPGVHDDALVAQISAVPLSVRAANVARAPQVTELVISLGEYRGPDSRLLPVTDLAVTADAEQLHLVSLSRRPVHTLLLNAVDLGLHSHPLTRFLAEAPVALAVPCTGFLWGTAASNLPFLPALRYGRTILSPARWLLDHGDLSAASAPWSQWDEALSRWCRDVRLPERVYLSEADQCLASDLTEPSHRALLRSHLDRDGTVTLRPAPEPQDLGWIGGRAHEVVIPLVSDQNRTPVRTAPHVVTREHGRLPGCGELLYVQLHGNPARQDHILTRHLPVLLDELKPPRCWFVRYSEPGHHLRLRLSCPPGALGATFEHVGAWTEGLRRHGLITHVSAETYHPEITRYGGPAAMDAAEAYFAADSTAVLAQLAAGQAKKNPPDARAVTAASMVDIATGLLRDRARAMDWLIAHTRTNATAPPRPVHRQAVELVHTHPAGLDEQTAAAWSARRTALADYADALLASGADPGDLLPDLLHLHHVRMRGPGLPEERTHLHLTRAAALSWTARSRRTA